MVRRGFLLPAAGTSEHSVKRSLSFALFASILCDTLAHGRDDVDVVERHLRQEAREDLDFFGQGFVLVQDEHLLTANRAEPARYTDTRLAEIVLLDMDAQLFGDVLEFG